MKNLIYFDNSATTKPMDICKSILEKYTFDKFFNPSAKYIEASDCNSIIECSREQIANTLNIYSSDFYFTPSATVGNNLIIQGICNGNKNNEYVFSSGEHPSVFNVANSLIQKGFIVKFAKLNNDGTVDINHLKTLINENTRLVSVIHVSNETGAVNDLEKIVKEIKSINKNTFVHSDGVQAYGKIQTDLKKIGLDFYTISSHKIQSVKGIAGIYCKEVSKLHQIIFGGGQEKNLVSGTQNVAAIVCFGEVAKFIHNNLKQNYEYVFDLKQYFLNSIRCFEDIEIISSESASPYIISLLVKNRKGEVLVRMLSQRGICVSTGSACSSKLQGNRVLKEMGIDNTKIAGALRISFCSKNTSEEIDIFIESLKQILIEYKG